MEKKSRAEAPVTKYKRERDEARETVKLQAKQINELQDQIKAGIEASPIYQRALKDAEEARADAESWKSLYMSLSEKMDKEIQNRQQASQIESDSIHNGKDERIIEQAPTPLENPKLGRPFKLDEKLKEEIRQQRRNGVTLRTIAKAYGISVGTAHTICKGIEVPKGKS